MPEIRVGRTPLHRPGGPVEGGLVDVEGERFYQVTGFDQLPPFLMTVASDADHFLFVSSTGALAAGRRHADQSLFPYTTDDRLHDGAEHTGPRTIMRVHGPEGLRLWEPLSIRQQGLYRVTRTLGKSVHGNKLRFEEINHDLGVGYSYTWQTSARLGLVRRVRLHNAGTTPVEIELLDGLQNVLPAGIGKRMQQEMSTLADAYKDSELDRELGLGIFRLSSIPVDAAEPSEALRATTVWCTGLRSGTFLLSSAQLDRFRRGFEVEAEDRSKGRRGAFFVRANLVLEPGASHSFYLVADVWQEAAALVATAGRLRAGGDLATEIEADVARGTQNLIAMVAAADGLQSSADELSTTRHFANVLFNGMRGGFPLQGYQVERRDLERFLASASRRTHERHADFLARLPASLPQQALLARARAEGDPDLERLVLEYLPLTFSRRHGDPSRPWNEFKIAVRDAQGQPVLDYQGNWRDLFQNWEALALSYPGWLEGMIARFLDASTADGHNPYRVTREGFEWEVEDPDDAWSYIGYWGDHQVVYLLRLLELTEKFFPGRLGALMRRRLWTFANVPYRIRSFEQQVADPQETIDFDRPAHEATMAGAAQLGTEGKLLLDRAGNPQRASMCEKLLLLVLARMASYIPEAGLWLNTQRPEWNDANNALVGNGASMVTLYHLRRFLRFARPLLVRPAAEGPMLEVADELAELFRHVARGLAQAEPLLAGAVGPGERRQVLESLARPMASYRALIYRQGFSGERQALSAAELGAFVDSALHHIDHAIAANRREDGLYHAYNLVHIGEDGIEIRRLPEMLEGQVAVLSSGLLSPGETLSVLDALRASALYRADQNSYLLYPDRELPRFLAKNRIPATAVSGSRLLSSLLEAKHEADVPLVIQDADGVVHFHPDLRNAKELARVLDDLARRAEGGNRRQAALAALAREERQLLLDIYERVFDHRSFTGRSGSFYKYEGLGCIYWHQVSKLLVAVGETLAPEATADPAEAAVFAKLAGHYHQIREGIGVDKPPSVYGALPIDPYSHTPAHLGAQQPGLTGQVKEDIISRLRELGVLVRGGRLRFDMMLLRRQELHRAGGVFRYRDVQGHEQTLSLPARSLAFTYCQVPIVYRHRSGQRSGLQVHFVDGSQRASEELALDLETSQSLFARRGEVARILVDLPD